MNPLKKEPKQDFYISQSMLEILDKEYDDYMKSNPTIERYHEAAATIVDPSTIGVQKPPSDFQKHVIGNIERRNPGRAQSKKFNVPKEW